MYRIIGKDGQQYGPVPAEQLRAWIAESRANAQTLVQADGTPDWKPLGTLPEFAADLKLPPMSATPPPDHHASATCLQSARVRIRSPPAFAASCWGGSAFISSFSATRVRG